MEKQENLQVSIIIYYMKENIETEKKMEWEENIMIIIKHYMKENI